MIVRKDDTQDMTTATAFQFEGIITIKGSGFRGARRAAAKAHNARLRISLRPRDAQGRFITGGGITNAEAAIIIAEEAVLATGHIITDGRVHIDQLECEGGWVTDAAEVTHGHANCKAIVGEVTTSNDGWMCEVCIIVPTSARILCHDTAPSHGTKTCTTCQVERNMTSFPTVLDGGWRMRGAECRKCRDARRSANRDEAMDIAA